MEGNEKLVFVEYLLSLRASALKWRGNPPVPPVIPSERSESRDLPCSFTFQLRSVRRSFDSLRSLRMTAWAEGWGLGGKTGGLPHHLSGLVRNDSVIYQTTIYRSYSLDIFPNPCYNPSNYIGQFVTILSVNKTRESDGCFASIF